MISMIDKPILSDKWPILHESPTSGEHSEWLECAESDKRVQPAEPRHQGHPRPGWGKQSVEIFFKVFLFSSESQVSMVAQYGSLASLERVRIPKFYNFDLIIVH